MKRGDKVTATITGTLVAEPRGGIARVSVFVGKDGDRKFWCVVPAYLVESLEEPDDDVHE